ncbi:MAG TPA: LUD domain-containing protein [Spirosoma sp.]|nr:LUD domain-containing protein [Spirosoma sp.]
MTSREKILQTIRQNKPASTPLPDLTELAQVASANFADNVVQWYSTTLTGIGGHVVPVASWAEIEQHIRQHYTTGKHRIISTLPQLADVADMTWRGDLPDEVLPHTLADVELAVIAAHFGVAENGAVWVTEPLLGSIQNRPLRVIPFITQHLAVVLAVEDLVPTMHDAYDRIGNETYPFGVFIAGPSKTADIEQSLVLGAHGPKTMTVFMLQ